jgi:hypothetical protein
MKKSTRIFAGITATLTIMLIVSGCNLQNYGELGDVGPTSISDDSNSARQLASVVSSFHRTHFRNWPDVKYLPISINNHFSVKKQNGTWSVAFTFNDNPKPTNPQTYVYKFFEIYQSINNNTVVKNPGYGRFYFLGDYNTNFTLDIRQGKPGTFNMGRTITPILVKNYQYDYSY